MTKRGWGLLVVAGVVLVIGRVLGLTELYMLSVASAALVAITLVFVRVQSAAVRVQVDRTLHPPRVYAGTASRVDLTVRNVSKRRTPVLLVRDPFQHGWRWARFLVPPLTQGTTSRAAYRLPTDQRGVYDIGPLEVTLSDPFGLATARFVTAGMTQLTVYPRIDRIDALPAAQGQDPHSGAQQPRALLGAGDEFYSLRQYEVGDDTRRVHWPSTARLGELMIRQDEMPWQTRVTILLDVRASVHTPESLESAVSAAASIHDASRRLQSLIRLVSTDGTDSGFAAGSAHDEAILEHLATVEATRDDRLAGVAATLHRAGNGGTLTIVTTERTSRTDLDALARLRGRYGTVVLVLIGGGAREVPAVTAVVRVTREMPFAAAWSQAFAYALP